MKLARPLALSIALALLAPGAATAMSSKAAPGTTANAITIAASPLLVRFGGTSTIAGQLTGSKNDGVKVELQESPYPFAAFNNQGATATTDPTGNYSFVVTPPLNTRYQVVAKASPSVTSSGMLPRA